MSSINLKLFFVNLNIRLIFLLFPCHHLYLINYNIILTFKQCNKKSISMICCRVTIDVTPLVYKKSKKSDKILIETKNLSKGLFAMNIITQNIRYYPHDLNTKFYAVRLYLKGYPLSLVCRRYHVSKSSLLRWMKKFDGTK